MAVTMTTLAKHLKHKNAWHERMSEPRNWPLARAIFDGFTRDDDKSKYLVTNTHVEPAQHYEVRKGLSEFVGSTPGIAKRLIGHVFQTPATVNYKQAEGGKKSELEAFADNADGASTSLAELIEENALEALQTGIVGFFIEKPARPTGVEIANREQEIALGVLYPRVIPYRAEEVTDWSIDGSGRLEWVKLERMIRLKPNAIENEEVFLQWIIVDRIVTRVYRAKLKSDTVANMRQDETGVMWVANADAQYEDPVEISPPGGVPHGAGVVPFVPLYGERLGPMRGRSPLAGSMRADLMAFNADSGCTFSEWLHGKPFFILKSTRKIENIIRTEAGALQLNPEENEDAYYESTPTDGFDHCRSVVESRALEAHRQAGADPLGAFENGGGSAESGRAKRYRFASTEERVLGRIAAQCQDTHHMVLEVAARLMSDGIPSASDQAFTGSVHYNAKFDLVETSDLIDWYLEAGRFIQSELWHRHQRMRIAMKIAGEVDPETRRRYQAEMDAAKFVLNIPDQTSADAANVDSLSNDDPSK